jgi:hypothetical protein
MFSPDGTIELVSEWDRVDKLDRSLKVINMYIKEAGQWKKNDTFYHEPFGTVELRGYASRDFDINDVYLVNGTETTSLSTEAFCFMDKYDDSGDMTFAAFENSNTLRSQEKFVLSGNGVGYDSTEIVPFHSLSIFKIIDGKMVLVENALIKENGFIIGFFMDCLDVNQDGYTDISIAAMSEDYHYDRDFGGVPILYMNDGNGHLVNSNVSEIPGKFNRDGVRFSEVGSFHDVNNDGVLDLIIFPNASAFPNDVINDPTVEDIFIYLGKPI